MKYVYTISTLILLSIFWYSCKRDEIKPTDFTEFDILVEPDGFIDTVYVVRNITVTSTNDSILQFGKVKIESDNGEVFFNDHWEQVKGFSFGLPERKKYNLKAVFSFENSFYDTINFTFDNSHYPSKIQLLKIDFDYDGSNWTTQNVEFSIFHTYFHDNQQYPDYITYHAQEFPPYSTVLNFESVLLNTSDFHKSYDWNSGGASSNNPLNSYEWLEYKINLQYHYFDVATYSSGYLSADFPVEKLIKSGDITENNEYIYRDTVFNWNNSIIRINEITYKCIYD